MKSSIEGLIVQKPNRKTLGLFPLRLWLYNIRYEKYQKDTANFQLQSKSVEPPVLYDSTTISKTVNNIKNYLLYKGYFYPQVNDTTVFEDKKAYVTYKINTGNNYLIDQINYDINDSLIDAFVKGEHNATVLKKGEEFSYEKLEAEQTRITEMLRNRGYYKFNKSFLFFELDTLNKKYLRDIENPFESAINFIALQKDEKKPTLNIKTTIRAEDEPNAYQRYGIRRLRVLPDYVSSADFRDTTMIIKQVENVQFRYHDYYVRERVLYNQIQLEPMTYYSQRKYDETISKLNELGIFQSVRIGLVEDSTGQPWLNSAVLLSPAKKYDFSPSIELANASLTNSVGTSLSVSLRNRNFAKGANLLSLSTSGGIEYTLRNQQTKKRTLDLLTRRIGANISINFPKFLLPVNQKLFINVNSPRTILSAGLNYMERVNQFTMINITGNVLYRWNETDEKQWNITPAFVSVVKIPYRSPSFIQSQEDYPILKRIYDDAFIEGQNITFIYTNKSTNIERDYSYFKISGEEAGGLINNLPVANLDNYKFNQYVKLDVEAQHFIRRVHSTLAGRIYTGIGLPYGPDADNTVLPYIKQYFAGGPYSIRGWNVRTLGPGSFYEAVPSGTFIDRTGDIKLEANLEYRFDIVPLFAGAAQLNGALFVDAGNIWLAREAPAFPGGNFSFDRFPNEIAIASGAGLRVDIAGLFVLRLDAGVPIKNPNYDKQRIPGDISSNWQLDKFSFKWIGQRSVLNFAIGYPF
jgi:outer membrane protein assembly factor BamA